MAKLIVALLLSVGLADGLASFGGCTCEVDDFKERFERLESLVEFIASKATASPTLIPPELNGCGEPCADVVTLDSAALDTVVEIDGNDVYAVDWEPNTCYIIDGLFYENAFSPVLKVEYPAGRCAKITVKGGSTLNGIQVYGDNTEIVNKGLLTGISARLRVFSGADGTKITNFGSNIAGGPVGLFGELYDRDHVGFSVTFKCYGEDVTVPAGEDAVCPSTPAPTPKPTGFGFVTPGP